MDPVSNVFQTAAPSPLIFSKQVNYIVYLIVNMIIITAICNHTVLHCTKGSNLKYFKHFRTNSAYVFFHLLQGSPGC